MQKIGEEIKKMFPDMQEVTAEDLLKMRVDSFNDEEGNLKGINCPLCKNKGQIMKIRYNELYDYNEEYLKECECVARRKILRHAKNSGLGEYLNKTFDDYKAAEEWQQIVKDKAERYVKSEGNEWFIMLGQSGAGKTLLCSIISNEFLMKQNRKVIYVTWTDFISRIKRDMMSDNAQSVTEYLDKIKNADILFIDELLKKYNETDLRYVIEIINYRYINNLKTIVTSERSVTELLDIDEATMGRMIELAGQFIINIPKDRKKNYRIRGIM
ncbi:MAG: ATP-binding protein [Bacilli bacterium]|nr:ATP-binding protein [Bacilli bacterium]